MSGTSLDGIDMVLAAIDEHTVAQQANYYHTNAVCIEASDSGRMSGVGSNIISVRSALDTRLGKLFAEVVLMLLRQTELNASDIMAIGCHAQTM
ncbi:MAG: anhydro-N-acetylmuramic acid kinase [Symbiopectobacterium sp.]